MAASSRSELWASGLACLKHATASGDFYSITEVYQCFATFKAAQTSGPPLATPVLSCSSVSSGQPRAQNATLIGRILAIYATTAFDLLVRLFHGEHSNCSARLALAP